MGEELIACFATIGGPYVFGDRVESPWDLPTRATAAGRAGYRGLGLMHGDLMRLLDRHGAAGIHTILADNGLVHLELEPVLDWFVAGDAAAAPDRVRAELMDAAARLGARHVKVAGALDRGKSVGLDRQRDAFQVVAQQARAAGTLAVLEPIAFSDIPDLDTGIAVLGDTVGRGGALLLDSWHVARGAISLGRIASLPPGLIGAVELNDGSAEARGDPLAETLNDRLLCGEGDFDLAGLIAASRAAGYDGPWGVEIFSDAQRERGVTDAAQLSFDTAIRQFGAEDAGARRHAP